MARTEKTAEVEVEVEAKTITIKNRTTQDYYIPIKGTSKQIVYDWQRASEDNPALSKVALEKDVECVLRHIFIPGSHYAQLMDNPQSVKVTKTEFEALQNDSLFAGMVKKSKFTISG
jgi:hypothetical protein